jgi:stearoyl-CoA desaturase (delta-9 desaturase)
MSVFDWCNDHRAHHRYTDTDKDPYSINKGFWYAHMGWLFFNRPIPKSDISDLEADPILQFQHKYYPYLAVLQGLVLPTVIAGYFWGDWWGGFLIAGVLSRVVVNQATFCVNSLAHYYGELTFSDQRTPRDSVLVGLLTFGEGYHNFHHEFPYDYRNGVDFFSFDPTKWLIKALSFVRLTYDLLYFSEEAILKGKLQMKEKHLALQRAALHWGPPVETIPIYDAKKVKELASQGEQLIVIDGFVHDVRGFLKEHPGGERIMKPFLNRDASKAFNGKVYNHSNAARNVLELLRIARFVQEETRDVGHSHEKQL